MAFIAMFVHIILHLIQNKNKSGFNVKVVNMIYASIVQRINGIKLKIKGLLFIVIRNIEWNKD